MVAIKCPSIWFEDGNIILQASDHQFRLHKGVLARHSQVFRDMFALPTQPQDNSVDVLLEGCSIVNVTDDPEDWKNVLEVIYNSVSAQKRISGFSLSMLTSMLRLGRKYEFDEIRDAARDRIAMELPNDLDLWGKKYPIKSDDSGFLISGKEFELVNVLSEVQLLSLLPLAYYSCIRNHNLATIFHGLKGGDDTASRLQLPYEIKVVLTLAEEKIRAEIAHHSLGWVSKQVVGNCSNKATCIKARGHIITFALRGPPISAALSPAVNSVGFCDHCFNIVQKNRQRGRQHIWDNLPIYFGLPKWEELHDF